MDKIEATSLTRADLAAAVQAQIGLSRTESAQLVETVLDQISNALVAGSNVKISSFGSFVLRDKGLRVGRNPKTGVEVPIKPRTVLTFRPSQILRDAINSGPGQNRAGQATARHGRADHVSSEREDHAA